MEKGLIFWGIKDIIDIKLLLCKNIMIFLIVDRKEKKLKINVCIFGGFGKIIIVFFLKIKKEFILLLV